MPQRLETLGQSPSLEIFGKEGVSARSDYFATLMARGHFVILPLNAGWTTGHTGTGASSQLPFTAYVQTGDQAGLGLLSDATYGLSHGITGYSSINFDKDLRIFISLTRYVSSASAVARIQLKGTAAEGVLANKGLGLQISNLTLVGESYDSGLATTGSQVLTASKEYHIEIRHTAGSKVEWFIDGVLLGTQSTAANIPSGTLAGGQFVISITQPGAAATSYLIVMGGAIRIWQED